MAKLNLYEIGQAGVNVVVNPLQLQRNMATQLQNVIFPTASGEGGIGKRGGLTRVNASALNAGANVLAIGNVGLPNPVANKYLYAAANGYWMRSTDGTTWAQVASPDLAGRFKTDGLPVLGIPPVQPTPGRMLYVDGNGGLDDLRVWNNVSDEFVLTVPTVDPGVEAYSAGASGFHNGAYFFGTIAYAKGRLFKLNPDSGQLTVIIGVMGTDYTAYSIFSFLGSLFVGVSDGAATPASYIYRCNPDGDTAWTVDSAALIGVPVSMVNFLGNLYIGTGSRQAGVDMKVYKRTPSGTYSAVLTDASPWNVTCGGQLAVFADRIFCYQAGVIYSSTDGAAWSSELDVYTTYSSFTGFCGRPVEFNGTLYWPFHESSGGASDGRVLKRTSAGVWSSVMSGEELFGLLTVLELP